MAKPACDADVLANRPEGRTTTQRSDRRGDRLAIDGDGSDSSWGKTPDLSVGLFSPGT